VALYCLQYIGDAIDHGLSKKDIQEVFLQAAIASFRCAKEALTEMGI
jgi:hypothetical protein